MLEISYEYARELISIRTIVIVIILGWIVTFCLWLRGIFSAVWRLGIGLSRRSIAIFAKSDNFLSLRDLLIDSTLFRKQNIFAITQKGNLGKAECATIYLVHWSDWDKDYGDILRKKSDQCALIVYAPPQAIPPEAMEELEKHRNTVVVNFRGRLLNDIVAMMITTAYQRK